MNSIEIRNDKAALGSFPFGSLDLDEEALAEVMGGKPGNFWHGLTQVVEGVGIVAAGVASIVAAPVTIPLAVTAGVAILAGAERTYDGVVEAYDARHTIDDGSPTRDPSNQQTGYARDALFF
jgi:hypothetical protein